MYQYTHVLVYTIVAFGRKLTTGLALVELNSSTYLFDRHFLMIFNTDPLSRRARRIFVFEPRGHDSRSINRFITRKIEIM